LPPSPHELTFGDCQVFLVCAEQTKLYFSEIEFPAAYLRWVFEIGELVMGTAPSGVRLYVSKPYDIATKEGRLDAAEVVLGMVKELMADWKQTPSASA
jgi:hypothetical protein